MQQEGRSVRRVVDVLQQSGQIESLGLTVEVAVLVHFQTTGITRILEYIWIHVRL